jgi:hypothetical protein
MTNESSFLFPSPSFLEGMGRLVDFAGSLNRYNYTESPEDADRVAITMDWAVVGDEISAAAGRLGSSR